VWPAYRFCLALRGRVDIVRPRTVASLDRRRRLFVIWRHPHGGDCLAHALARPDLVGVLGRLTNAESAAACARGVPLAGQVAHEPGAPRWRCLYGTNRPSDPEGRACFRTDESTTEESAI
jgi:hypothetical protein